jgi:ankyrin repeat-rich membrane spanning protein
MSTFLKSIFLDDLASVRNHLEAGTSANATDETGSTPLISASGGRSLSIVQLLLDFGADINHGDIDGFTALMCAAGAGRADTVRLLISKGALVNKTDHFSRTALSWAMTKADVVDVVKMLLDFGADPNHIDETDMTPLMRAALLQFPRSFDILLKRGANPSISHRQSGKTAFDMAIDTGNPALLRSVKEFK